MASQSQPISAKYCLALLVGVALLSACGGSLYKVKPVVELPPMAANAKTASAGGVSIKAAPILSDEETQELFEANLLLAGVLPVRLEMAFESGTPVEIKKARFHLRDSEGREWKQLSPKAAISRILKADDVYTYNPNSRKQFEKEFVAYAIDLQTPLSTSDRIRQGFVFFQTPNKEAVENKGGLVLTIEKLPQPVTITLN